MRGGGWWVERRGCWRREGGGGRSGEVMGMDFVRVWVFGGGREYGMAEIMHLGGWGILGS